MADRGTQKPANAIFFDRLCYQISFPLCLSQKENQYTRRYIGIRYKIRTFVVDLFHSGPRTASKPIVQKSIAEAEAENEPRKATN